MTAKKQVAKKAVTPATPTAAQTLVRNALVLSAHATINAMRIEPGDEVRVCNFLHANGNRGITDRHGGPLPAGCGLSALPRDAHYGENVVFHGINANGNVMVGRQNSNTHIELPYTFITHTSEDGEKRRANLKLNDAYTGTVLNDGSAIAVGCQRFKTAKLRELLDLADKTAKTIATRAARTVPALTANPAPTYTPPAPKAAVTKTTTKAVKRVSKKAPARRSK